MRHYIYLLPALLATSLLASCYQGDGEDGVSGTEIAQVKRFTFHVKGDFQTDYEDMTRASVRLEEDNTAGVTDLWVFDYVDGVKVQEVHQKVGDKDFGHPQMDLTYGSHSVKFVASKGDGYSLAPTSLSWTKVKDTFVLDYPVEVSASSNGNRAPELKRAVSGVKVAMTDKIKSGTTKIETVVSQHYASLTLPSLSVGTAASYTNTYTVVSSTDLDQSLKLNTYTLAPEDAWQTDVTVKVYEGTAVVSQFVVPNVELKRNRMTVLTGSLYGQGSGFSVAVDDAWDEGLNISF